MRILQAVIHQIEQSIRKGKFLETQNFPGQNHKEIEIRRDQSIGKKLNLGEKKKSSKQKSRTRQIYRRILSNIMLS